MFGSSSGGGLHQLRYVSIALVVVALAIGGCGGSEQGESTKGKTSSGGRALTQGEVMSVHLGTPLDTVLARLGPPSATGPRKVAGDRCYFWRIAEQPAWARWRFCFKRSRLHIVATYLG
jgi:hypothetical protein